MVDPETLNQRVVGSSPTAPTKNWGVGYQKGYRAFPFGLGKMLPSSPSSMPALASAFTTAVMVPLRPSAR